MRIFTWNMQGTNAGSENKWNTCVLAAFSQIGFDAACIQECGLVPPSANPAPVWRKDNLGVATWLVPFVGNAPTLVDNLGNAVVPGPLVPNNTSLYAASVHGFDIGYYTWGTTHNHKSIFWMKTDTSQTSRVNLAIVTRAAPDALLTAGPGLVGGRPAIGVRFTQNAAHTDIFCLHAWSNGGNDAANLLTNIFAIGANTCHALGDFNREPPNPWTPPQAHAGKQRLAVPGNTFINHPNAATRDASGRLLDYMVSTGSGYQVGILQGVINSDHKAVGVIV